MRYSLRTLLIVMMLGGPALVVVWRRQEFFAWLATFIFAFGLVLLWGIAALPQVLNPPRTSTPTPPEKPDD